MQIKIALLGGPGSGKTTLANAFTAYAKSQDVQFYNIPEFAREFIDKYGNEVMQEGMPFLQLYFQQVQMTREDATPKQCLGYISDSPIHLSWIYSIFHGQNTTLDKIAQAELYKEFLNTPQRYTHVFHVAREKKYILDGTRAQTEEEAQQLDVAIVHLLKLHKLPFVTLTGSTTERVTTMWDMITSYKIGSTTCE